MELFTNKLLMVEHPERGIWYFSNINKAAVWIGIEPIHLRYCFGKKNPHYKDYTFEWVDGSNVMYKYINPQK